MKVNFGRKEDETRKKISNRAHIFASSALHCIVAVTEKKKACNNLNLEF